MLGKVSHKVNTDEDRYTVARSKKDLAKRYLEEILCEGDCATTSIIERMAELGISSRTVQQAKSEMNITAYKSKNCWFWHLKNLIPLVGGGE